MSDEERFWHYVDRSGDCWAWKGAVFGQGRYGAFWVGGKTIGAHIYSARLAGLEVRPGEFVCHACDNPACVRPNHLFIGEPRDNTKDMLTKSRGRWPRGDAHHLSKLTEADVADIRSMMGKLTQKEIAAIYGVDQSHISRIMGGHKRGRPHATLT